MTTNIDPANPIFMTLRDNPLHGTAEGALAILADLRETVAGGIVHITARFGASHPALLPAQLALAEADRVLALGDQAITAEWAVVRYNLMGLKSRMIEAAAS